MHIEIENFNPNTGKNFYYYKDTDIYAGFILKI